MENPRADYRLWYRLADLSIEAPPSLIPARHYCDITGLEASSIHLRPTSCTHDYCRHRIQTLRLASDIMTRACTSTSRAWSVVYVPFCIVLTDFYKPASAAREYLAARGVNPVVK